MQRFYSVAQVPLDALPAVVIYKSAITVSPAFRQSLFESQLEDYASDMQRVYWHVYK